MKSVVIAGEYPWPVNSGSRMRLETILGGLRRCGPTDLFSIVPGVREDIDPPDDRCGLDRVGVVHYDDRPGTGLAMVGALARRAHPVELSLRDGPTVTRALARFASGRYDLIWYFGVRPWALVGGWDAVPTVLDVVDLEDYKIAARLNLPRPTAQGVGGRLRRVAGRALSTEEVRRWARLQARASARCSATVVCSVLDADRAASGGMTRIEVVPNAYRRVGRALGKEAVGRPPTVLFQGTLRYPPNADAATFLVDEVAPVLRRRIPDVRIRLVGPSTPALARLDDPPRVLVVGRVPDMDAELDRADLVVVPVRFGSGTRLKILEAFAHRIPVVSTTLGAEGLGAEDGVHLLLADTAADLASACVRLLTDTGLRGEMASSAYALFEERFAEDVVEGRVAEVARRFAAAVSAGPGAGPGPGSGAPGC